MRIVSNDPVSILVVGEGFGIRRLALSPEPARSTDSISVAPASSAGAVAPAAGPTGRPGNGGLGRGLAGILGDERSDRGGGHRAAPGLLQLVGAQVGPRVAEVGRFVVETALGSVADAFGAEGLILVGRSGPEGGSAESDGNGEAATDRPAISPRTL